MTTPKLQDCDLIMKGGITSGIVYPSAILCLQNKYRFRNIGGASSGAIAAAFTAAAELGRDTGGFGKLQVRRDQLAAGTFLKDLLQPTEGTRPLLHTAYAAWVSKTRLDQERQAGKPQRGLWRTLRFFADVLKVAGRTARPGSAGGAAIVTGVAAGLAALAAGVFGFGQMLVSGSASWRQLGLGALLLLLPLWCLVALIVGVADLVRRFAREVPRNFFGLCNGRPADTGQPGSPALTDWIHESIQDLAGVPGGPPLTFGDLAGQGITLRMMTTNLSHNQGYQLPYLGGQGGDHPKSQVVFAFCAEEFRRLFPDSVVDFMAVPAARNVGDLVLPEGYFAFPRGADLPVLVATRMSLSFPVLLSAVPLYTVRRSAVDRLSQQKDRSLENDDLQRNWFSDGGIASNFPIHFFDDWLPSHPTFGIQLTDVPPEGIGRGPSTGSGTVSKRYVSAVRQAAGAEQAEEADALNQAVYLPRGSDVIEPEWQPIEGWGDFGLAIFNTLHDAHDNLLSSLPGYRERVVQVRLSSDEGGFNLTMPKHTVDRVMAMGDEAGQKILRYFSMDQHRWVRFRVLMAELERNLAIVEERLVSRQFDEEALFTAQVAARFEADPNNRFPYPRDQAWCAEALEHVRELRALAGHWRCSALFGREPPTPEPVLRVVPRA
jgi:hypothetical protein